MSLEHFLANFKRGLLCFSLNSSTFFCLKAFHPLLVKLHTVAVKTLILFCWTFLQNLSCWIITLKFSFRDYISRIICQNRWPSTVWFVLEGLTFWSLVHPSFGLFKQFGNFFDWIVRIPLNRSLSSSTNRDCLTVTVISVKEQRKSKTKAINSKIDSVRGKYGGTKHVRLHVGRENSKVLSCIQILELKFVWIIIQINLFTESFSICLKIH